MKLSVLQLIYFLAILQGLAICALLALSRYFRSKPNFYLALSFGTVAVTGLIYWFIAYGYEPVYMTILNNIMWEYLFPVPFLMYCLHATKHPQKDLPLWNLLYLPFFITLVINLVVDLDQQAHLYTILKPEDEVWLDTYFYWEDIGTLVFALSLFMYAFSIIWVVRGTPAFKWPMQVWMMSMAIILFWVLSWLANAIWGVDLVNYLWASLNLLFFWINIKGISQFKLAEDRFEIRTKQAEQIQNVNRQGILSAEGCENPYFERLEKMMRTGKLFRDPGLNRELVADRLGISTGYLSQVVSNCTDHNFSEYINAYRVAEVKDLLENPDFSQYSLLAIGLEAGFNAKSTYFSVFKKIAGMTPSEYKKSLG